MFTFVIAYLSLSFVSGVYVLAVVAYDRWRWARPAAPHAVVAPVPEVASTVPTEDALRIGTLETDDGIPAYAESAS